MKISWIILSIVLFGIYFFVPNEYILNYIYFLIIFVFIISYLWTFEENYSGRLWKNTIKDLDYKNQKFNIMFSLNYDNFLKNKEFKKFYWEYKKAEKENILSNFKLSYYNHKFTLECYYWDNFFPKVLNFLYDEDLNFYSFLRNIPIILDDKWNPIIFISLLVNHIWEVKVFYSNGWKNYVLWEKEEIYNNESIPLFVFKEEKEWNKINKLRKKYTSRFRWIFKEWNQDLEFKKLDLKKIDDNFKYFNIWDYSEWWMIKEN